MASIRKIPSGRYQLNFVNSAGKRARRNFRTWKEANAAKIEIEGKIARGIDRPHGDDMRLGDVLDSYVAHLTAREERREISRKHLAVVRGHMNWLKSEIFGIGQVRLKHLSSGVIVEFRDAIRNKTTLTAITVRKILGTLHSALEFARERDLIAANPAHGIRVEAKRSEGAKKITPPSKETVKKVLDACVIRPMMKDNSRERQRVRRERMTRMAIQLAAVTGLRASEQWGLRWKNVDFDAGTITVASRVDAYRIEDDPKSKAGFREVPVSDWLLRQLREWRAACGFNRQSDLVFANNKGGFTGHDNFVKRQFKPAIEIAKQDDFGWHSLRHFAISTWIEAGYPPKAVQTMAGHSSITITMDRYGHMFPDDSKRDKVNAIAADMFG